MVENEVKKKKGGEKNEGSDVYYGSAWEIQGYNQKYKNTIHILYIWEILKNKNIYV
jgi:hypothetical protein